MSAPLPDPALTAFRALLGERLSLAPADREHHGRGESYHASRPPAAPASPGARRRQGIHACGAEPP
jgi:hypothetical protein